MSKKTKVLFYGIIQNYSGCQLVAVTTQKAGRWSGMRGHWYGRLLRPGLTFEDAAATNGTSSFIAEFDTREEAEAAYAPILASQKTFRDEQCVADAARDAEVRAARERHEARIALVPGVRKPAS